MTFFTQLPLDNRQVKQLSGDTLALSGETNFAGILKSKGVEIDANAGSATTGYTLTYDGNKIVLQPSGSERILKTFPQAGNDFELLEAVGYDNNVGEFVRASAVTGTTVEAIGLVTETGNSFTVTFSGYIRDIENATDANGNSFSGNTTYYLSSGTAGKLTPVEPPSGQVIKPMLVTLSTGMTGAAYDALVLQDASRIATSGGTAGNLQNVGVGEGKIFVTGSSGNLRSISGGTGINVQQTGGTIVLFSSGGTLGVPSDGTYLDGLFPFTPSTTIGNAVDDINEFLAGLAPPAAPELDDLSTSGSFVNANLSFGVSNNDVGYAVVTGSTIDDEDINDGFIVEAPSPAVAKRVGVHRTGGSITGILNDDVVGDIDGPDIPYDNNAFRDGDQGTLSLILNGSEIDSIDLTSTTAATTSTYLSVSELKFSKFNTGADFTTFNYRTGTYSIAASDGNIVDGFNVLRVVQSGGTITTPRTTNYIEFVRDSDASTISASNSEILVDSLTTGSKFISGVEYHLLGQFTYSATTSNVYRNVYRRGTGSFNLTSLTKLVSTNFYAMEGDGIVDRSVATTSTAYQPLDSGATDPAIQPFNFSAETVSNGTVLGSAAGTGTVGASVVLRHAFNAKNFTGAAASLSGFLIYPPTQTPDLEEEDFIAETYRLEDRNYALLTYAATNGGSYDWNSEEDLITGDSFHNTGLLVFDGALHYPNSSYLTTNYGITAGDFSSITFGPAGNPDYSSASGQRNFVRRFKSNNTTTQSTITMEITHTGNAASFLTDGGTGGVPFANNIKLEFLIMRTGGSIHGWANPFAPSGNPEGIANTALSHAGGVTTVSATLSTVPRIGDDDLVIVRIKASDAWTNRISNIEITNI